MNFFTAVFVKDFGQIASYCFDQILTAQLPLVYGGSLFNRIPKLQPCEKKNVKEKANTRVIYYVVNEWKHFRWQFLLSLRPVCVIVFLLCLHFCVRRHFEIVRCIAKSLIATAAYFCWNTTEKRTLEKRVFPNGLNASLGLRLESGEFSFVFFPRTLRKLNAHIYFKNYFPRLLNYNNE